MDLNHLHLHVRDLEASRRFYERWFSFAERVRHEEILFLRNAEGFDLALVPDAEAHEFPRWFHFGFRLEDASAVRGLRARMKGAGLPGVGDLHAEAELVSFRCADPDGHRIEVYWE